MRFLFQILFSLFGLFAIYTIVQKRQTERLSRNGMFFWLLLWAVIIMMVLYPESASQLAHFFGIGRGVDVLVYISIATVFFLLFKLHVKVETINRDITKLVRRDALEQENKKARKLNTNCFIALLFSCFLVF